MKKTAHKLHYETEDPYENFKMYMRVTISLQILTFMLMFVVYLILIRKAFREIKY